MTERCPAGWLAFLTIRQRMTMKNQQHSVVRWFSLPGLAVAQQHTMPSGKMTDDEIIKSAMSAAPEAIGKGATIIDVGSDGKIRVVRQGTNQFTCMADNPTRPVQTRCVPTETRWNGLTCG
jgi:hypothetical protein